jgi:hypothetical protein
MRNRGVNGDDEIERRDRCGGIGKIAERRRKVDNVIASTGTSASRGDGMWPATRRFDAARDYRLALDRGVTERRYLSRDR